MLRPHCDALHGCSGRRRRDHRVASVPDDRRGPKPLLRQRRRRSNRTLPRLQPCPSVVSTMPLRGAGVLVTRGRRQYDFETKLKIVRRHVNGESGRARAEEHDLPSPTTVANWTVIYRRDGEDGLRPKRRGRPPTDREDSPPKGELETLRTENETSRRSRVLGKIAGLEVAGTTGESSSCRRSQGAISAGTLAARSRTSPNRRSTTTGIDPVARTAMLSSKKPFMKPSKMRRAPTGTDASSLSFDGRDGGCRRKPCSH